MEIHYVLFMTCSGSLAFLRSPEVRPRSPNRVHYNFVTRRAPVHLILSLLLVLQSSLKTTIFPFVLIMPSKVEDLATEPPKSIDPYEVLSISNDATEDQIKKAYRKAALKNHPGKDYARAILSKSTAKYYSPRQGHRRRS